MLDLSAIALLNLTEGILPWKKLYEYTKELLSHQGTLTSRTEKIQSIAKWYHSERLVLVLGAGASASYGLPDWNTLLQKLLLITLKSRHGNADDSASSNEKASLLAHTFTNLFEPNSLIAARYLSNHFREHNPTSTLAFENAIRSALYDEVKSSTESALLKEIRQYCIAAGRSPNIDSIITYNYDDLLEQCLSNIELDIPYIPIYTRGMKHKNHELPIYHVHGYLPSTGNLTQKNRVILAEDGYHKQYSDTYGWSNLVQINKFKDHNCLFIGLSFSDPNLRRILDISKNERGDNEIHHYCFRKRYDRNDIQKRLERLLSENDSIVDKKFKDQLDYNEIAVGLINLMERFDENDASSFGVGVMWVDNYDEIPELMKEIRTSI